MISENKEIIWLTENYPPQKGGMAQSCDRIVDNLRKAGITIHLFHFTNRKEAFKQEIQENGSYTALPMYPDESHTLHLAYNYLAAQTFSVQTLVVFGGYLPMIAAPIFKQWLSLKLVLMIRGNDFDSAIFSPKKRLLIKDAIEAADHITCISESKAEMVNRLFEKTIKYIPNGIQISDWKMLNSDHEFTRNWKKEKGQDEMVIGCFGHLKEKKGVDILIKAMKSPKLQEKIMLLLIGDMEDKYLGDLKEHDVHFELHPFMERLNLIKYYACCDAIVLPSHYDGMPNVLLEAGALGIPIIGSNKDGISDVVNDGEHGLLFKAGDPKDLREVLFKFISMPASEKKAMGESLKNMVKRNYNHEVEIKNYLKILNQ